MALKTRQSFVECPMYPAWNAHNTLGLCLAWWGKWQVEFILAELYPRGKGMVATGCKVHGYCHIEDIFYLDYYSMAYYSHALSFYYSAQDASFEDLGHEEAIDVKAVLDIETMVVDTEPQRHTDTSSME